MSLRSLNTSHEVWNLHLKRFRNLQQSNLWESKDLFHWILNKLAHHGRREEFLTIWREMKQRDIKQCSFSFFLGMRMCARTNSWGLCQKLFYQMEESNLQMKEEHTKLLLKSCTQLNKISDILELMMKLHLLRMKPDSDYFKELLTLFRNDLKRSCSIYNKYCVLFRNCHKLDMIMLQTLLLYENNNFIIDAWRSIPKASLSFDSISKTLMEASKQKCILLVEDLVLEAMKYPQTHSMLNSLIFACSAAGLHETSLLFFHEPITLTHAYGSLLRGLEVGGYVEMSLLLYSEVCTNRAYDPWKVYPNMSQGIMDFHGWGPRVMTPAMRFFMYKYLKNTSTFSKEVFVSCGRGKHSKDQWKPVLFPAVLQLLNREFWFLKVEEDRTKPGNVIVSWCPTK